MDKVSSSRATSGPVRQAVKHAYQLLCSHPILILFALIVGGSVGGQQFVIKYNYFQQGFTSVMTGALFLLTIATFLHFLFLALIYKLIYGRLNGSSRSIKAHVNAILASKSSIMLLFTLLTMIMVLLQPISQFGILISVVLGFFTFFGFPILILQETVTVQQFFKQIFKFFWVSIVPFVLLMLLYCAISLLWMFSVFCIGMGFAFLAYLITSPAVQFSVFCKTLFPASLISFQSLLAGLFLLLFLFVTLPIAFIFSIVPSALLTILYHQRIEKRH